MLHSNEELARMAVCVASGRPAYGLAYIQALERAGRIRPGVFQIHDAEMLHTARDQVETERGAIHAERGRTPTFVDTNIT
jgi:hypothetical protein